MTRDKLHKQGSLDGLCGVYSVVNALTLMAGPRRVDGKATFAHLIQQLGPRLPDVAVNGMRVGVFKTLIEAACEHVARRGIQMEWRPAFRKRPRSLSEFWARLALHQFEHGEGSVLVGVSGLREHWTCIRRITPRAMILADSGNLRLLQRSRVTVAQTTIARPLALLPSQTFLLKLVD